MTPWLCMFCVAYSTSLVSVRSKENMRCEWKNQWKVCVSSGENCDVCYKRRRVRHCPHIICIQLICKVDFLHNFAHRLCGKLREWKCDYLKGMTIVMNSDSVPAEHILRIFIYFVYIRRWRILWSDSSGRIYFITADLLGRCGMS